MVGNKECTEALLVLSRDLLALSGESRARIEAGDLPLDSVRPYHYTLEESHRLTQWVAYKSREVYVHGAANMQSSLVNDIKGRLEYYSKNQDHPVEWRGNTIFTEKLEDLLKVVQS